MIDKVCLSKEWWTPRYILDAVREYFACMTGIDQIGLDPATGITNPTDAERFFVAPWAADLQVSPRGHKNLNAACLHDRRHRRAYAAILDTRVRGLRMAAEGAAAPLAYCDGLAHSWKARSVFVNPPFGGLLKPFLRKLERESRRLPLVPFVQLLPNSRTEQAYWQADALNDQKRATCYVRYRVPFLRPDGTVAKGNPHSTLIMSYNGSPTAFAEVFKSIGTVEVTQRVPYDGSLEGKAGRARRAAR